MELVPNSGGLFSIQLLGDARHVDDHALVRAVADFLDFVARRDGEFDAAAVDLGDDGLGGDAMATGVAARWRTFTTVPTQDSPGSRYSRTALSAAFSITVTIIGVAKTGGRLMSLNWLARCAGITLSE